MKNPYTYRNMIRDPAMFFGRTEVLIRIYNLLSNMQCVSIIGDRRIGKSSLLYCLAFPEIQGRVGDYNFASYLFSYSDLQGSLHRDPAAFLQFLIRNLTSQLKNPGELDLAEEITPDVFEEFIGQLNGRGLKPVFLLDEFDSVTQNERLDAPLFSFLRYMATNYDLSIITVSQNRLEKFSHSGIVDSPFFNIFAVLSLGPPIRDEALELITVPSTRVGYSLADKADWVLDIAGLHPLYVQIACFYLLDAMAHISTDRELDYESVQKLFYEEAKDHFEYAWDHLTEQDRVTVQKTIWQNQGPYAHYLTSSSAFREFGRVRSTVSEKNHYTIQTEDVETALDNLWDLSKLGESPLIELKLVRAHLAQNELEPIVPNLGRSLYEILTNAISYLKTEEQSGKASKRWRYWYILNGRYIEGEQNKNIIAQLNVAERTFYRERKEAIAALAAVLEDLEANII